MSVIDILFRVDEICKKYDKYDIEKQRDLNAYGDDAFAHLYSSIEAEIESAFHVRIFIILTIFFFSFYLTESEFYFFIYINDLEFYWMKYAEIWDSFNGD